MLRCLAVKIGILQFIPSLSLGFLPVRARMSATPALSVRIGCDKSGKAGVGLAGYQELSQCWLLSAREVTIFAKKYLSVFFKCL